MTALASLAWMPAPILFSSTSMSALSSAHATLASASIVVNVATASPIAIATFRIFPLPRDLIASDCGEPNDGSAGHDPDVALAMLLSELDDFRFVFGRARLALGEH